MTKTRKELAALIGTSDKYLYLCLSGRKNMSAAMAARVERESDGVIKRQQLRRDWRDIWPELAEQEAAP